MATTVRYDPGERLILRVSAPGARRMRVAVLPSSRGPGQATIDGDTLRMNLPRLDPGEIQVDIVLLAPAGTELEVTCQLGQGAGEAVWRAFARTDAAGRARLSTEFQLRPRRRYRGEPDFADPGVDAFRTEAPPLPRPKFSTRAKQRPAGAEYVVWYGTNRKPVDPADPARGYSAERDDRLHYGRCRVFIPRSHRIGSTGSRWWKRMLTRTDDRLRLEAVEPQAGDEHWADLRRVIAGLEPGTDHAVVFIHGYNVSFHDAALRAAQVGFDLQVRAMAFFSWPSRGTLQGYLADSATIEASEAPLAAYLTGFARHSGASHVHVIAHSMGNRGLLRAVNRSLATAETRAGVPFGQFILAAPDVDADVFSDLSRAYQGVCRRATLYVSPRDRAVAASLALHGAARVGYTPPVTVLPHIDTVSVQNVDLTVLGHGYVAEARDVLHDMHDLIFHGDPPERRMGLHPEETGAGRYWVIGA
jgi:esterase/lipase superfamily enzyme